MFARRANTPVQRDEQVFDLDHLSKLHPKISYAEFPVDLVSEMAQAEDLSEIFDCITFWQQRMFSADRASLVLNDGNGMLTVWALRGSGPSKMDKSVPLERGRLGRAVKNSQLILSCDLANCSEPDGKMLYAAGLRRSINAPLRVGRVCIGAINLAYQDPDAADPELAFRLQLFADWVAPIIRSQQSFLDKVSEARAANMETERARGDAQAKTSFIANISHEIRTPLNGILGMAQMLASDARDDRQAQMVDTILGSGQQLLKILNDVIDISRIEAGKMLIVPVRNAPRDHIARIFHLWEQRARQSGLEMRLKVDDQVPDCVIYDATRVEQCVTNLLSNAVKFTDDGEITVELAAKRDAEHVTLTITVADSGIGIDADQLDALFEPFKQADGSSQRRLDGSGLGLSICRRIARLMDGDVNATTIAGIGSAFEFSFRGRLAHGQGPVEEANTAILTDPDAAGLTGKRILVVEDIPTNRLVVEMFLARLGASVTHAEHGAQAMEILADQSFDLVLLDMHMPVMDGAATISAIRTGAPSLSEIPVIALTADALHGDRERHLSMGLNGFIAKPLDAKQMVAEIRRVLG